MTGDITDTQPLPDAAGIVPRVLYSLFNKIGDDEQEVSVKCSFIELYNEELRDLLAADDNVKLKIYDDNSKKGQTSTLVQGMEESHIKNASKGLELLRNGSHKRQVAATKCNDLSSRSHTVFTITVYMKRTSDTGEDFVSAGKLNLVDLAGSENIQRSGAENKRAAEAGLINKSLLTLGRVINALVEKSSHIPYRESKLTRLLQDSLGGRTKTCIIATLSPAKSNLEETISTLDYAFRAKNIRNKPQVNQMVSKKTLLKEFTAEIEKLKSELIATRQRNGVYLTQEAFEEMTTESESRRILADEQKDKIEIMEINLRNKVQELFNLTNNFSTLKKENEQAKLMLDGTKSLLEKTEIVLAHTKRSLADETLIRKAHQRTEAQLANIGEDLLSTLDKTTGDIQGLHSKLRRKSDLQSVNRHHWASSKSRVLDTTELVDTRVEELRQRQETLLSTLTARMQSFVHSELGELQTSQAFLQDKADAFDRSSSEVNVQTAKSRDDMNEVLEEIKSLREDVKQNVGAGLKDLSAAAQRITAGIASEMENFHTQLHTSYLGLGREFKSIFDDVVKRLSEQQAESARLRAEITSASTTLVSAEHESRQALEDAMEEERKRAAEDRERLVTQITGLIASNAEAQENRISAHLVHAAKRMKTSEDEYAVSRHSYDEAQDNWNGKSQSLIESCIKSRENVKNKIKGDWNAANDASEKIKTTTEAVHDETVRIVDKQMSHLDTELLALDEIVARVRKQNDTHHEAHTSTLAQLSANVQESYKSIGARMDTSYTRTQSLSTEMDERAAAIAATFPELGNEGEVRELLRALREETRESAIAEYQPTGQTPSKRDYSFPTALPRTEAHETLLEKLKNGITSPEDNNNSSRPTSTGGHSSNPTSRPGSVSSPRKLHSSPSKGVVWNDADATAAAAMERERAGSLPNQPSAGLREIDVNITANSLPPQITGSEESRIGAPPLKRAATLAALEGAADAVALGAERVGGAPGTSKLPMKRAARNTFAGVAEGRENVGANGGARGGGRRLRPRGSD